MNAIGRIEVPEDTAVPVPTERLEELYAGTVSYQAANARKWRRRGVIGLTFGAVATVTMFAEAWAIVEMLPLVRVVPVMMTMNADGSVDTHVMFSALPKDKRVAAIQASLWQYVRLRESYSFSEWRYNYDVVSAMSEPRVREQFQTWVNGKSPNNPVIKYAKDTTETALFVGGGFLSHDDTYSSGVYQITFMQQVWTADAPQPAQRRMVVTLTYTVADNIPAMERVTMNPDGVIVTEYPGAQPAGAP